MNPAGKARMLTELPGNLRAITAVQMQKAGDAFAVLEAKLTSMALEHDPANDAALREELGNYISNLTTVDAPLRLV